MPTDTKPRTRVVVEEVDKNAPKETATDVSSAEPAVSAAEVPVAEPQEKSEDELNKPFAESVMPDKPGAEEPEVKVSESGPNPLVIIIPGVLLLGALLGGIIYFQKTVPNNNSATPVPTPLESSASEASPSAKPVVDLSKYEIKILNGSGIAGEAGKAQSLLEKAGFSVASTGNATDYSFTKTIIEAKEDVDKGFLEELKAALGKAYEVGTSKTLAESSKDEVVVTVGSTKK